MNYRGPKFERELLLRKAEQLKLDIELFGTDHHCSLIGASLRQLCALRSDCLNKITELSAMIYKNNLQ